MVVEKICEALVSDSPKDLMISRTSEGFILNIRDHLSIQKTFESSLLNKRRHLVFDCDANRLKTTKTSTDPKNTRRPCDSNKLANKYSESPTIKQLNMVPS